MASCNNKCEYDFKKFIDNISLNLSPTTINTLQVNITKLCNQACLHCHVDASPKRKEQMDLDTINRCLEILNDNNEITNLDLTGGAPELNPHFDYFVQEGKKLNKHIMVRHNLTVTFDGNPVTGESKEYLPSFFAENKLEVISSLPYYQEYFTDKQRGKGVFEKSIDSIRILNMVGYGTDNPDLQLNLVYNPVGAFLPADQASLENDFKYELKDKYDITFNRLFTITNMPINRFKQQLKNLNAYNDYMNKLINSFNPDAANGIMCKNIISVSYDGKLYDCDFNQMLDMNISIKNKDLSIHDFDFKTLVNRKIRFGSHCFGCTAGNGSCCGGNTT
jgi:radical SAM/Cys-rich protein